MSLVYYPVWTLNTEHGVQRLSERKKSIEKSIRALAQHFKVTNHEIGMKTNKRKVCKEGKVTFEITLYCRRADGCPHHHGGIEHNGYAKNQEGFAGHPIRCHGAFGF